MPGLIQSVVGVARRRRRGGVLLEASLVLPVLLAVSFGAVEFGYYIFMKQAVQGAAREGARASIFATSTNAKVNTAVANAMTSAGLAGTGYSVEIRNGSNNAALNVATAPAQTPVKIIVKTPWSSVSMGLRPLQLIDAGKQVTGTAVMSKE